MNSRLFALPLVLSSLVIALFDAPSAGAAARLTADFSTATNPFNNWSLGWQPVLNADFVPYDAQFYGSADGNTLAYWGRLLNSESWVRQNQGPESFSWPLQGDFPLHSVSAAAGPMWMPDSYAVTRYTVPADGTYRISFQGVSSGISDVDVHLSLDGFELGGRNLLTGEALGFTNEQFFAAGTTLDLAVGRGEDLSNYGAIFVYDGQVEDLGTPEALPPEITITPWRGSFPNKVRVALAATGTPGELHYTVDGNAPTVNSPLYERPFVIRKTTLLQVALFRDTVRASRLYQAVYRIADGTSGEIPDEWWLAHFGDDYDNDPQAVDGQDADNDGRTNLQEYLAGTDPKDPLSGFGVEVKMVPCVVFSSVPGTTYQILRKASLVDEGTEIGRVTATAAETRFADPSLGREAGFYQVRPVLP